MIGGGFLLHCVLPAAPPLPGLTEVKGRCADSASITAC